MKEFDGRRYSMWKYIRRRQHDVHDALMSNDDGVTSIVLSNPAQNELYYGMDSLFRVGSELLEAHDVHRTILATFVLDTFARLAEATGARCAWNPEAVPSRPTEPLPDYGWLSRSGNRGRGGPAGVLCAAHGD